MSWTHLIDYSQIQEALTKLEPFLVFKHSTRCSISTMAKTRLERQLNFKDITIYYLDILNYRAISDAISNEFLVVHQSPQLLLIQDGKCTYHDSHNAIDPASIKELL
jgi:bacillithiol system protein YtxJ